MEHNLKFDLCPTDFVITMLASRWTLPVIRSLANGPKRPSEISSTLERVSAKTLTQRLRELEQYGILVRTAYDEIPPRVVYELTERGKDLLFILDALTDVGASWQNSIFMNEYPSQNFCVHCHERLTRHNALDTVSEDVLTEAQRFDRLIARADAREHKIISSASI